MEMASLCRPARGHWICLRAKKSRQNLIHTCQRTLYYTYQLPVMTLVLLLSILGHNFDSGISKQVVVWWPKFCIFIWREALLSNSSSLLIFSLCAHWFNEIYQHFFNILILSLLLKLTENWTGVEVVKLSVWCSGKEKTSGTCSVVFAGEPDCSIDRTWPRLGI